MKCTNEDCLQLAQIFDYFFKLSENALVGHPQNILAIYTGYNFVRTFLSQFLFEAI